MFLYFWAFFFTFLLHKPVCAPHLVKKLCAQVSDLIPCINVCVNKFNFFFQRHCKVWSKLSSSTSWQEEREVAWVQNLLLLLNLLKNTWYTETHPTSIWMCLVHMGWGKTRNSVHDQSYLSQSPAGIELQADQVVFSTRFIFYPILIS